MTHTELKKRMLVLFTLLLITSFGFAQEFEYPREKALASAVFESLQAGDVETFSSYCISADRLEKVIAGLSEDTPEEIEVKTELGKLDVEQYRSDAISGFESALELEQTDQVNWENGVFPKFAMYSVLFEVPNLKHTQVTNKIAVEKTYNMVVSLFKTKDDIFIFAFYMNKGGF